MKRLLLLLFSFSMVYSLPAINVVSTPGGLLNAIILSGEDFTSITELSISGSIDARDFRAMRDTMPSLSSIDLSNATIAYYIGVNGTEHSVYNRSYQANTIPQYAFYHSYTLKSKTELVSIVLRNNTTQIGSNAFNGCVNLANINIPTSLTSLGSSSLMNCPKINSINLPNTLTTISSQAFSGCIGLTSINIPSSVTQIGIGVFNGCTGLTTVEIPESVTNLGSSTFNECTNLVYAKLPSNATDIGSSTFFGCTKLQKFDISQNITTIELFTFYNCNSLKTVVVPPSVKTIGKGAFSSCDSLISVRLPSGLKTISEDAFVYCPSLQSINIPASVSSIGSNILSDCTHLEDIYSGRNVPVDLQLSFSSNVFKLVDKTTCKLYVPIGCTSNYQTKDQWKDFTQILEVDTIKNLHLTAGSLSSKFSKAEALMTKHLTLSGNINLFDIFYMRDSMPDLYYINLEDVTIDEYIGEVDSIYFGSTLGTMVFPANTLPMTSFKNKPSLKTIILPNSLTAIQKESFRGCSNLRQITCSNLTPINLTSSPDVFLNVDHFLCILFVPNGTTTIYRASNQWKDFFTITSPTTTDTQKVSNSLRVFISDDCLVIDKMTENLEVEIYDLKGVSIYKNKVESDKISVKLPAHGVYIVVAGDECSKVIY